MTKIRIWFSRDHPNHVKRYKQSRERIHDGNVASSKPTKCRQSNNYEIKDYSKKLRT